MGDTHPPPVVDLIEETGIGVIISWPSGVMYTSQTGGVANLKPRLEGVYVPLTETLKGTQQLLSAHFTGPKWRGNCYRGIDDETADFIDATLRSTSKRHLIRVDRERLADSHEAWVYVRVDEPPRGPVFPAFSGFGAARGVLTWLNSD
jgi:Family of unknown function (DUF6210)